MKIFRTHKAYTLLEMIITLLCMGALAGLAMPRYFTSMEMVKKGEAVELLIALLESQQRHFIENDVYVDGTGGANDLAAGDLDIDISAPTFFNTPKIYNNAAMLAALTRRGATTYRLRINSAGTISCDSDNPAGYCQRLGYP